MKLFPLLKKIVSSCCATTSLLRTSFKPGLITSGKTKWMPFACGRIRTSFASILTPDRLGISPFHLRDQKTPAPNSPRGGCLLGRFSLDSRFPSRCGGGEVKCGPPVEVGPEEGAGAGAI